MKHKKGIIAAIVCLTIVLISGSIFVFYRINREKESESQKAIVLENIGNSDLSEKDTLELPGGLAGVGIKSSDSKGNMILQESVLSINREQNLDWIVTLYNAQEEKTALELLLFIDNKQIPFHVNHSKEEVWNYKVDMTEKSYLNMPIQINMDSLNLADGKHDVWFVCEYDADNPTTEEKRYPFFQVNYHFYMALGDSQTPWHESALLNGTQNTVQSNEYKNIELISFIESENGLRNPFTLEEEAGKTALFTINSYYGKEKAKYQTFVIMDGRSVPLSTQGDAMIWNSDKTSSQQQNFQLEIPAHKTRSKIYTISFPLENSKVIFTSERMNLEIV